MSDFRGGGSGWWGRIVAKEVCWGGLGLGLRLRGVSVRGLRGGEVLFYD
jgi:hypothetical protein